MDIAGTCGIDTLRRCLGIPLLHEFRPVLGEWPVSPSGIQVIDRPQRFFSEPRRNVVDLNRLYRVMEEEQ